MVKSNMNFKNQGLDNSEAKYDTGIQMTTEFG